MRTEIFPVTSTQTPVIPGVKEHGATSTPDEHAREATMIARALPRKPEEVVKELNEMAKALHTQLAFSIDEETQQIVIRVLEAETQKVIRQIPAEEVIRASARIQELLGVIVDESA